MEKYTVGYRECLTIFKTNELAISLTIDTTIAGLSENN